MFETANHEMYAGGISIRELVRLYSEPLYVYDAGVIETQYQRLRSVLPSAIQIIYSMKANPNPSLVGFLRDLVYGIDVSSLREMYIALAAGYLPSRIFFVGPSKSEEELRAAVSNRIGCLMVESEQEMVMADRIASSLGEVARVAIRVNPSFDSSGSKLKMGGISRQFGIDEEIVTDVIRRARGLENLCLEGLHVYLGTRILDSSVICRNTLEILKLTARLREETGLPVRVLDIGGGLGVPYFPGEPELDLQKMGSGLEEVFSGYASTLGDACVLMEVGRFLVAEAGVYVSAVRYVKSSRGQKYVLVSGGLNHHQAASALGTVVKHNFPISVLNKIGLPPVEPATVCGPLCTPTDVIGRAVSLPEVEPGDLIGILKSGAYGLTASPVGFLSQGLPNEVLVYNGQHYLIRKSAAPDEFLRDQEIVSLKSAQFVSSAAG